MYKMYKKELYNNNNQEYGDVTMVRYKINN